jgi:hypothetical protein
MAWDRALILRKRSAGEALLKPRAGHFWEPGLSVARRAMTSFRSVWLRRFVVFYQAIKSAGSSSFTGSGRAVASVAATAYLLEPWQLSL